MTRLQNAISSVITLGVRTDTKSGYGIRLVMSMTACMKSNQRPRIPISQELTHLSQKIKCRYYHIYHVHGAEKTEAQKS